MHTKYYSKEKEEVPSVTTVLKVLNKPALNYWANMLGFKGKSYKKELDRTARVGTLVHKFIEENMKNKIFRDLNEAFELENESTREVFNSYRAFKIWYKFYSKEKGLKVIESEKSLVSNIHGFGGTIDLIAELEGENYIIDFKTSAKTHSSMFLQLSAYANMAKENGIKIDKVAILQLSKKNGTFTFTTMPMTSVDKYFNVFKSLISIYNNWGEINKSDWNIEAIFN